MLTIPSNQGDVARGIFLTMVAQLLQSLLLLIFGIYVIKILIPSEYGATVVYNSISFLLLTVMAFQFPVAIARNAEKKEDRERQNLFRTLFVISFSSAIISSAVIILLSGPISDILFNASGFGLFFILMMLGTMILSIDSILLSFLLGTKQFARMAISNVIKTAGYVGMGALLVSMGLGIIGIAYALIFSSIVQLILCSIYSRSFLSDIHQGHFSLEALKKSFGFVYPLVALGVLGAIMSNADRLLLGGMKGTDVTAYQGLLFLFISYIDIFSLSLSQTIYPYMRDYFDCRNLKMVNEYYNRSIKYIAIICFIFLAPLLFYSTDIIKFLSTDYYSPVSNLLWLVPIFAFLTGIGRINSNAVLTSFNTKVQFYVSFPVMLLSLIGGYFLINSLGIVGAEIEVFLTLLFSCLGIYFSIRRRCGLKFDWPKIALIVSVFLLPNFILFSLSKMAGFEGNPLLHLGIAVLAFSISIFLAYGQLDGLDRMNLRIMLSIPFRRLFNS